MTKATRRFIVGAAMAGILAGAVTGCSTTADKGSAGAASSKSMGKHDCAGKNACKGQGGCKTATNSCKGQNECKGKGGCKMS